jgi:hypothetical protein
VAHDNSNVDKYSYTISTSKAESSHEAFAQIGWFMSWEGAFFATCQKSRADIPVSSNRRSRVLYHPFSLMFSYLFSKKRTYWDAEQASSWLQQQRRTTRNPSFVIRAHQWCLEVCDWQIHVGTVVFVKSAASERRSKEVLWTRSRIRNVLSNRTERTGSDIGADSEWICYSTKESDWDLYAYSNCMKMESNVVMCSSKFSAIC